MYPICHLCIQSVSNPDWIQDWISRKSRSELSRVYQTSTFETQCFVFRTVWSNHNLKVECMSLVPVRIIVPVHVSTMWQSSLFLSFICISSILFGSYRAKYMKSTLMLCSIQFQIDTQYNERNILSNSSSAGTSFVQKSLTWVHGCYVIFNLCWSFTPASFIWIGKTLTDPRKYGQRHSHSSRAWKERHRGCCSAECSRTDGVSTA